MSSRSVTKINTDRSARLTCSQRLGYLVRDAGYSFYWALIGGWPAAFAMSINRYADALALVRQADT